MSTLPLRCMTTSKKGVDFISDIKPTGKAVFVEPKPRVSPAIPGIVFALYVFQVFLYTSLSFTGAIMITLGTLKFPAVNGQLSYQEYRETLSCITIVQPGQPEPGLAIPAVFPFGTLRVVLRHE